MRNSNKIKTICCTVVNNFETFLPIPIIAITNFSKYNLFFKDILTSLSLVYITPYTTWKFYVSLEFVNRLNQN